MNPEYGGIKKRRPMGAVLVLFDVTYLAGVVA